MWPSLIHKKHWDKWVHELGTGCHLWVAGIRDKRPSVNVCYKTENPARLVCTEIYGPSNLQALHVPPCNNYLCINPDHLYWGTRQQNEDDKNRGIAKFVQRHECGYRVRVKGYSVGLFKYLDDAIAARDKYLRSQNADIPNR